MSRTVEQWRRILTDCQCTMHNAEVWAPVLAAGITDSTFSSGERELPDFLGQVLHETSMLSRLIENLNYSKAERIKEVWPKRFTTVEAAIPFVHNPQALANYVYGGRMGNVHQGDGWKYRGRGFQVTGHDNYLALGNAIAVDLVADPDRLAEPAIALKAFIAFWERSVPDSVMGDIKRVTLAVNGGDVGLADRLQLTNRAAEALIS